MGLVNVGVLAIIGPSDCGARPNYHISELSTETQLGDVGESGAANSHNSNAFPGMFATGLGGCFGPGQALGIREDSNGMAIYGHAPHLKSVHERWGRGRTRDVAKAPR